MVMNDELLMKYIDGTATPEEEEIVLTALSKDDEAAKEWLQMVQGARLAGKRPAVELPAAKQGRLAALPVRFETAPKKKRRWLWGVAAAVAAASVVLWVTLSGNNPQENNLPELVADVVEDTSLTVPETDYEKSYQEALERYIEAHKYCCPKKEYPSDSDSDIIVGRVDKVEMPATAEPVMHKADSSVLQVLHPSKTPYAVRVRNLYKEFVFEWETADVDTIRLQIADACGDILFDQILSGTDKSCPVPVAILVGKGELVWTVKAWDADQKELIRMGNIHFIYMEE